MMIRSKVLAAAVGLVIAFGAVDGAFAQSGVARAPTPGATLKTNGIANHRLHVAHRGPKQKLMVHRVTGHAKTARTSGRAFVVGSREGHAKVAQVGQVKSHVVKAPIVKKHLASRTTKPSILR